MQPIRHIVFDIGKVLLHYDPHLAYKELIPDEADRRFFLEEVCSNDWNLEQDRGRPWADAEAEAIARHPDKAELIRAFRQRWSMMVPHAYEDSVAVFRETLASGHDVTLLTNFAPDTFVEARKRFPFLNETRGVTVSGELGLVKPDLAIYRHHAATFDLDPAATLFLDDSEPNVEGALKAGWRALHFTGADKLRADLASEGVKLDRAKPRLAKA
ncbi:2-haloalkanoic acid dehalogenase [Afifella marina DSM 2698]|nr:2-haloalkanoic acid dehalogenase [Afifella marina DSM 2698]MBK1625675.1 2-haloalkanoic acid dehalogenase [Afifella marina]MBK5917498.1 2-haloalkanoic acid dehalogenase [Afifella marina]RAI23724.1 2-haloalkanoic acid dehalogenase [Afifella marina DSM 2698]